MNRYSFEQVERWVQFNNDAAPLTLRANTLRITREQLQERLARHDVETTATQYAPDGLLVTSGNPLRTAEDDSFFIQDEASQLVPLVMDAQPGERILDLCASPGGKTVAMAASMHDSGTLIACDVRAGRLSLLSDTIGRSGARHVHIVHVPHRDLCPSAAHSTACSWMRRAPVWARSAAIPISVGGAQRASYRVSRSSRWISSCVQRMP